MPCLLSPGEGVLEATPLLELEAWVAPALALALLLQVFSSIISTALLII